MDYLVWLVWLLWFLIIFPAVAYLSARRQNIRHKSLLKIKLFVFFIPASMVVFALLSNYFGIGLDTQSIPNSYDSHLEFFIALDDAERPYVNSVFVIILLQLLLTISMMLFLKRGRMFALAFGLCSFHLSMVAGLVVLNVLLGEWPGS